MTAADQERAEARKRCAIKAYEDWHGNVAGYSALIGHIIAALDTFDQAARDSQGQAMTAHSAAGKGWV